MWKCISIRSKELNPLYKSRVFRNLVGHLWTRHSTFYVHWGVWDILFRNILSNPTHFANERMCLKCGSALSSLQGGLSVLKIKKQVKKSIYPLHFSPPPPKEIWGKWKAGVEKASSKMDPVCLWPLYSNLSNKTLLRTPSPHSQQSRHAVCCQVMTWTAADLLVLTTWSTTVIQCFRFLFWEVGGFWAEKGGREKMFASKFRNTYLIKLTCRIKIKIKKLSGAQNP